MPLDFLSFVTVLSVSVLRLEHALIFSWGLLVLVLGFFAVSSVFSFDLIFTSRERFHSLSSEVIFRQTVGRKEIA